MSNAIGLVSDNKHAWLFGPMLSSFLMCHSAEEETFTILGLHATSSFSKIQT